MAAGGTTSGTYAYDGREQLIARVFSEPGQSPVTVHTVHDARGNVVMEVDGFGARREYIWLPDAGYAGTDLPVAVVETGTPPAAPALYFVHADHLGRPILMTDAARAAVWQAVWTPWGVPQAITGTLSSTARFPGQWFQVESGLHYNWHRHYDPSLGRYTQPDPLGFVDGPNVYAYAVGDPVERIDVDGRAILPGPGTLPRANLQNCMCGGYGNTPEHPVGDGLGCLGNRGSGSPEWGFGGHRSNRTPSNREKHEKGDDRRIRDKGGEKADWPEGPRRPPAKRPKNWRGKWPPTLN